MYRRRGGGGITLVQKFAEIERERERGEEKFSVVKVFRRPRVYRSRLRI